MTPAPTPEAQLAFLTKLQRLFAEGDFTATYKYALMISLADLAVEVGRDDGDPLLITNRAIAAKFIELYWQQTAPYAGGAGAVAGLLAQNKGTQAAVVTAIAEFRRQRPATTVHSARSVPGYGALVQQVAQTVRSQPVRYLQNLGGQTDEFLYESLAGGVVLKPGVGFCLRRFQPLVQQLARSHWVGHIKRNRLNLPLVGQANDLESFLFEASRQTLSIVGAGLRRVIGSNCFYCGSSVNEADVDHFIPFSLHPRDLCHNFVLSHPACNRSKSDTLAARQHLARWIETTTEHNDALCEIGEDAGLIADLSSSRAVANWGYSNALAGGAQAWIQARTYEQVDNNYLDCFA